jgi:hypothetical protein
VCLMAGHGKRLAQCGPKIIFLDSRPVKMAQGGGHPDD